MKISGAQASVAAIETVGNAQRVRISTLCGQGRYTLRKNCVYLLAPRNE